MRILTFIGAPAVIGAIAAAVFFFGGYFNIAATQQDTGIVAWGLIHVRAGLDRPPCDRHAARLARRPAMVQAGAKAFATRGCVDCHGGPGAMWQKFSEGLNPAPPDLKDVVGELSRARSSGW